MSSTIIINGATVTVELTNFTEAVNFDFGNAANWSPFAPTVIDVGFVLVEADVDLAGIEGEGPGPITNPLYSVTIAPGESAYSSGLIVSDPGATVFVEGYLEIDWVSIQNMGGITVSPGGVLQAGISIGNTVFTGIIGGLAVSGGTIFNSGTINSGDVIEGGAFLSGGVEIVGSSQGEISNGTTLKDLTFYGDLDLTKPHYNIIDLNNVTFANYAGVAPEILLNGTGGALQSIDDQTIANVTLVFGPGIGTIASLGTNSTMVIAPTTTLQLDNSDFYVANTDTLVNEIEIDSNKSNQQLSFAGQAFIQVIVNPGNGIFVPMAAGVFENAGGIVLTNAQATNTIFDIDFTNEAGALLSVTNATLGDHQFTSTFENDGSYQIGSNGTVDAYDQSFYNNAGGVIEISADAIGAGTLALGTMDIQSGGKVFTVAPSIYVNNGLIELDTTAPAGANASPFFYIGAGSDFTNIGRILFTNNGTIVLGAGLLDIQSNVTIDGGTIIGDGGAIFAVGGTIENATLTGQVNLTSSGGGIWLYNDSYAANAFSQSVINVSQQGVSLFLRDDAGLTDLTLNLGVTGDPSTELALESTILTIQATSTLNVDSNLATIVNGIIPNVGFLQTTLYNAGLMQVLAGVLDISTTGLENAGQFTISDNVIVNVIGANATNLASGQITIGHGGQLAIGNAAHQDTLTNAGGILVEGGGYIGGLITLTANDPLAIQTGGILLNASIVGGTITGDGALAWGTDILDGVLYAGGLTVQGNVEVENNTSFIAAAGAAIPDIINISDSAIGGGTELSFRTATTFANATVEIGSSSNLYAYIAADTAVTIAASVTIDQDNTYAGIDADAGFSGSVDNEGAINANFLNGTFVIAGLTSFTNDGFIGVANGETLDLQSSFTQNANGVLMVGAGAVLMFSAGLSMAAGAVIEFAAGSTFDIQGSLSGGTIDLNGANISGGSIPGSGVFDDVTINDTPVTISGTVTFIDVTYVGSPVVEGDLLLEGTDTFQAETLGGPLPVVTVIAGLGTLDFVSSQTLDNAAIDFGSIGSTAPAILMVGSGVADAAITFGPNLLIDQNDGGSAILQGTVDDLSSIDDRGSIVANQSAGTLAIQLLAGFANDGGITVSNGDDFVIGAPFTENADGTFQVTDPGTLTVAAAMTITAGATLTMDPSSQLIMAGSSIQSASPGSGTIVWDTAVLHGTGEMTGLTLLGSPIVDGDLELATGNVFMGPPAASDATPTLILNTDSSTIDVLDSQALSGLDLSLGSPDSGPAGSATFAAGLGDIDANVTLAAGVTLMQSDVFATLTGSTDGNSTIENDGQIDAEVPGGLFSITSLAGFANTGDIEVQNGDSVNVGVTISNTGTIDDQAAVTFADAVNDTGTIMLGGNAQVTFDGSVGAGQQIVLNDGLIEIADPMDFAGTIDNFGTSDTLWFPNATVDNPTYSGGQLSYTDASNDTISINLQDSVDNGPMQEISDGNGGFFVGSPFDASLPCFAAGTRIATPMGEVAVELLSAGDLVSLADGSEEAIVWIGHRDIDVARYPDPRKVWPVRVAADTLGPGQPSHDLFLSPDHAVFVEDVLVPVKYLINGTSIAQIAVYAVTYYHVELAAHDILLAQGLPVESYLEIGDRSTFTNGGEVIALFPDLSARGVDHIHLWEALGHAPLVVGGTALERVKARIDPNVEREPSRMATTG